MNEEDRLLIDQLTSEYRIIQDKIDKIGSFRFTVKGWSVTLVIASIFATGSSKSISPFLLLLLLWFVWLFYGIERKQNRLGLLFGQRALRIEKEVHRIIRSHSEQGKPRSDVGPTPWIAYHLRESARNSAPSGGFPRLIRWIKETDRIFYLSQTIVVILAVAFLLCVRSQSPDTPTPSAVSVVSRGSAAVTGP